MTYSSRRFIGGLVVALALALAACSDDRGVSTDQSALISDHAHGGGTRGFYFLAPLVPQPHPHGVFEPRLAPVVRIDQVDPVTGASLRNVVEFNSHTRVNGTKVRVHPRRGYYIVRWRTDDYDLSTDAMYRIRILVDGRELGFADVDVVRTRREVRNVDRNEYVPLKLDSTLPIVFRIETEAVDQDGDGVTDGRDNCPTVPNGPGTAPPPGWPHDPPYGCDRENHECDPEEGDCHGPSTGGQLDTDHDGIGDACECLDVVCGGAGDACHPGGTCEPTTGACTGGAPLPDGDGDGACDPVDGCPVDPTKTAPGACGCGVPDTDTDQDHTANCLDGCPVDPAKTGPGACGCGVADTDTDHDNTADCLDACPADPAKLAPGLCGCGVADTDTDHDNTADCLDACPVDPAKLAPGVCGCGVADTDTDHDNTADCFDACPVDPAKLAPGVCGCGVADLDSDHDNTPNCLDACPADPGKVAPGVCGCGLSDADSDHDGTANCQDACPADAGKVAPGVCGCGVSDVDSDHDGTANCHDACPADPAKLAAGACGCGVADTDSDHDGVADCHDACPADPAKAAPGACGCGVVDTDGDHDGTADCVDACPVDPAKAEPGVCGCGAADADTDTDGTLDCLDACPADPAKILPGTCGCGAPELAGCGACADPADPDGDGAPNCVDACRFDADKTAPGVCGCGRDDGDGDADGVIDCLDPCPGDGLNTCPVECSLDPFNPGAVEVGTPFAVAVEILRYQVVSVEADGTLALRVPGQPGLLDGRVDVFFVGPQGAAPPLARFVAGSDTSVGLELTALRDGDYQAQVEITTPDVITACVGSPVTFSAACGAFSDADGDGVGDCQDGCPTTPGQTDPGPCGCGVPAIDADNSGLADCLE